MGWGIHGMGIHGMGMHRMGMRMLNIIHTCLVRVLMLKTGPVSLSSRWTMPSDAPCFACSDAAELYVRASGFQSWFSVFVHPFAL